MIEVELTTKKPNIDLDFTKKPKKFIVDIGPVHSGAAYPEYEGPTTVLPEITEMQILQTEKKSVMENILVMPIPVTETHNEYGGLTVVIG